MDQDGPVMLVVAGPPGGGKSSTFPVAEMECDYFDADRRCAELNGGSWRSIPQSIRNIANREFEAFIEEHIAERKSFTFETTLRSAITFEQSKKARQAGFKLEMVYVALRSVDLHLERVAARADGGGHSASEGKLREIHASSMVNLRQALAEFDEVRVYDNSGPGPELALICQSGRVTWTSSDAPQWASAAAGH